MKRTVIFTVAALLVTALAVSCAASPSDEEEKYTFTTDAKYREMAAINSITVEGSGTAGVFTEGRTVTLSSYRIAKYETTYELWYEVWNWGVKHGYRFANTGREGMKGSEGKTPGEAKLEPVTFISWRDTIVWCNAYSEMSGLEPVYYRDKECTEKITWLATEEVYVKSGANGYCLPIEAEWEAAARGGNPSSEEWSTAYTSSTIGDAAWYTSNSSNVTQDVGGKKANGAGIYDMAGNVWEWVFDWYSTDKGTGTVTDPQGPESGELKMICGGACNNKLDQCQVTGRKSFSAGNGSYIQGFRVVRH